MYIPKEFKMNEMDKAIDFIQTYNFGILVSNKDGIPIATHLPFVVEKRSDKWFLITHFSNDNPQKMEIEEQTALVIFSEPHAYISPSLYSDKQNVPTWNYVAVHCYGKVNLITEKNAKIALLEQLMQLMDANYLAQWADLPERYKSSLLDGMIGMEIEISHIDAKEKISQNKPKTDQQNIIEHLNKSTKSAEQQLGEYMNEHFNK